MCPAASPTWPAIRICAATSSEIAGGVIVRRYEVADAEALGDAIAVNLEHLRPWIPWVKDEPLPIARRRTMITAWREQWEGGDRVCGMFLDGRVVGGCGLHRRIGPGGLEIGYWVHVGHTGRGFATAAAAVMAAQAFRLPGIERVEIHHDKANLASGRVAEKLGFELTREDRRPVEAPAESGISCIWTMSRRRWQLRTGAEVGVFGA